jgi:hypothetical protein
MARKVVHKHNGWRIVRLARGLYSAERETGAHVSPVPYGTLRAAKAAIDDGSAERTQLDLDIAEQLRQWLAFTSQRARRASRQYWQQLVLLGDAHQQQLGKHMLYITDAEWQQQLAAQ